MGLNDAIGILKLLVDLPGTPLPQWKYFDTSTLPNSLSAAQTAAGVVPGVEVLLSDSLHLLKGKRVGLIGLGASGIQINYAEALRGRVLADGRGAVAARPRVGADARPAPVAAPVSTPAPVAAPAPVKPDFTAPPTVHRGARRISVRGGK